MKPVVVRSVSDPGGTRCVDILDFAGAFGWVLCRRDPEDWHGWRHEGPVHKGFASADAAWADARAQWPGIGAWA